MNLSVSIKAFRISVWAALLIMLIWLGASLMAPPKSSVEILPPDPNIISTSLAARLWKFAPKWVYRLRDSLFGPRPSVTLQTVFFSLPQAPPDDVLKELFRQPVFSDAHGIKVWIADSRALKRLRAFLERAQGDRVEFAPKVTTGTGTPCSVFAGQSIALSGRTNDVGLDVRFLPTLSKISMELLMFASFTEFSTNFERGLSGSSNFISIRTNLALSAKLQIPRTSGVFLLSANQSADGRFTALMLLP
ncbi:MAG TPA: hypothetical protein VGR78_04945 [Verrucomicrobiae bacterium]|jgi:hypothetical protein|nr:hypothetical protein [Verrucomicrobiae bacterium]